jgi:hypothetical protein
MIPLRHSLNPFGRAASALVRYLLHDEFPTAAAAPLSSPRACEPGPGTATITDTANKASISGGALVFSGRTVSNSDPSYKGDGYARSAGLAAIFRHSTGHTGNYCLFGWFPASGFPATDTMLRLVGGFASPKGEYFGYPVSTGYRNYAMIARQVGGFIVIGDKLTFVDATANNQTIYPGIAVSTAWATTNALDYVRVKQLGAPWTTDAGIYIANYPTPTNPQVSTSSDGDTFIEFTSSIGAGVIVELDFRRTDADNRWILRIDGTAKSVKIIQRQGGIETERASGDISIYIPTSRRFCVSVVGPQITFFIMERSFIQYGAATFNQAATGIRLSGFSNASNFIVWPGKLTGSTLDELQRYMA